MSGGHARKPCGGTSAQPAGASSGAADPTPGKRTRSEALGGGAMRAAPRPDRGVGSAAEQHATASEASVASLERTIELAAVRMHGWSTEIENVRAKQAGDGGPGRKAAQPKMTGYLLESGGRQIAHFTTDEVEINQCKGYVKGTPDMVRTATVIINPS
jgi:hypothetical protein